MVYPSLWKRPVAFLIDILLLWSTQVILGMAFIFFALLTGVDDMPSIVAFLQWINLLLLLVYFPAFEASSMQATPGKWLIKIKVTDLNGCRISWVRAFLRTLMSIIACLPVFIGYLTIFLTAKRQCLHDKAAGSLVLNRDKNNESALSSLIHHGKEYTHA